MRWVRRPASLPGQIALLVALALFVAQAINFALLLRERREFRLAAAVGPAATRLTDASERLDTGRSSSIDRGRGRVRLLPRAPVSEGVPPVAEAEAALRTALADANVPYRTVRTGLRPLTDTAMRMRRMPRAERARMRRAVDELVIAVEQPGRGWLVTTAVWPRAERGLVVQLAAQTLILYVVVLLAVLWIGRRIARPLGTLAGAAGAFRPGEAFAPVTAAGPADVRAVILAYNALGARVTAMLDEKDRMLGAIGHDLRTPLAALRVRIEGVEDEADRARMAEIIAEMTRMLEDILSLARLGRPGEPPTLVDLGALVDAVIEDFRDLGRDVTLVGDPPRITASLRAGAVRRVVRNLVENAVKYAGAAEVAVTDGPDGARIAVRDRGPGIPEDRLATVFDPFVRLEGSRNRETGGSGLGLALARAIVEEAGGRLTLANRTGGGLVADVHLPTGTPVATKPRTQPFDAA